MTAIVLVRLLHVISAVIGGGLVAGVAIVASRKAESTALLVSVTRTASLGLAATFLTGIGLDVAEGGALHEHGWFRLAGLSMVVTGALIAVVRRRATRVVAGTADASTLATAPWLAYAACAVVVWMTVLMELQPF